MSSNLQVFENENFTTRTITDANGEVWFVAKDVAQALGYSEASNTARLFQSVPKCWTEVKRIHTRSENGVEQEREMLCLTEQGLYFFLGRSDKKAALPYQMWVAGQVVPSIRKHGAYLTPQTAEEIIANPDLIIRLAEEVKAERAKNAALAQKVEADRPKVIFAEAVDASKESILIGNLAKILCQNGISVGQNRLFNWLRERGFLITGGERHNIPKQEYIERGYFEVKKSVVNNPDGSTRVTH
ncbi:MAG: phage antirepressor KilAC domain-containing protein, partial [Synergistaceae bacterium]|nr:phage antirepressor KilAC domain-containing protein [Synergistaceae bacterium]